jgi:Flp pilus assembly CpaF family ATPase
MGLSDFESAEIEKILGWRVFSPAEEEIEIVVSSSEERDITRLRNGKTIYIQKSIPCLSLDEARLLKSALQVFRDSGKIVAEKGASEFFIQYCKSKWLDLEDNQKIYLKRCLSEMVSSHGILGVFLCDPLLEEIAVIGLGRAKPIYVFDSNFGWLESNIYFSSEEEVKNIVNALGSSLGRRVTLMKPKINASLPDGSRLNACMNPITNSGPSVTIRKFRANVPTPTEIIRLGSASSEQMAFLWLAIQSDCSIMVCGNTGSGKTTLLNSIMNFIPENERIVIVEETPEISIMHQHCIRMNTAEGIEIGMAELVTNTLRMRPDRVIVGEIRDKKETLAYIDSLLAGQGKGTYSTFHAQSANEAITRLIKLGAMPMDVAALDLVLTQKRWTVNQEGRHYEQRKLIEIAEPLMTKNGICIKKIFSYDFKKKSFKIKSIGQKTIEKISNSFNMPKKEIINEIEKRSKFLETLRGKTGEEYFNSIQQYNEG